MKKLITSCFLTIAVISTASSIQAQSWLTAGNTGLTASGFIGTKDAVPLILKTNNKERGRILTNGKWQFGFNATNSAIIDSLGKLSFTGRGSYYVSDNRYIFHYSGDTAKGLFLNSTLNQYQFLNSSKTPLLYVNGDNGNSGVAGTFKIGAYTLPKSDGTNGQVLTTNGTGTVTWKTASGGGGGGWGLTGNAGTTNANFLGTTDNRSLILKTHDKERIRIKNTGEIGIGTTTPKGAFNVIGTAAASLTSPGYFQSGDSAGYNIGMDNYQIQSRYNASPANLYLNNLGGTVFMGNTSSSYYGAIVYGSAYGIYAFSDIYGVYGNGNAYGLYGNSSNIGVYGSGSNAGGYFYTSSGNVALEGYHDDAGGSGQAVYGYEAGSGEAIHGDAYGSVGYGVYGRSQNYYGVVGLTGNSTSYAAYFGGNVYTTGTYNTSDEKLKQNIKDMPKAMDILTKLHPKQYQFRQDGNFKQMNLPQGEHYGLLAQEVEKILPGLVKETISEGDRIASAQRILPDTGKTVTQTKITKPIKSEQVNFKALNYTELISIIIKGMQEQQSVIDNQQTQINQQQQQIDDLKAMVQTMAGNASSIKTNTLTNSGAYLLQNSPNPFSQSTSIRYNIPSTIKQAQLVIYSGDGRLMKSFSLNKNSGNITIDAGAFSSGTYTYSLITDGKNSDTKTMVITK